MKRLFAATHESGSGTFRTSRDVRLESGLRTKADVGLGCSGVSNAGAPALCCLLAIREATSL